MSYGAPNFTQIPNLLLDEQMAQMSEAELRVTLAIARQTFGWHKESDVISLSQLIKMTGLSRQGVINGVNAGIERGTIKRYPEGQSFTYQLVVNQVDQSDPPTSQRSRPVLVNVVDQQLVNVVDTQKKGLNKDKEKNEADACAGSASPTPTPAHRKTKKVASPESTALMEAYITLIKEHEPGAVINYQREREGINRLAAAGCTPDRLASAYRTLKAENFWKKKHISSQTLGTQMGALVADGKGENQKMMELAYEW